MAHTSRITKKMDAPRPLQSQTSRVALRPKYTDVEEIMQMIESYSMDLQTGVDSVEALENVMESLHVHGPQLEALSKDTLDRAFVVFRNASQNENLNITKRMRLLDLIESRAKNWIKNVPNQLYYKPKQTAGAPLPNDQIQLTENLMPLAHISTSPTFGPGVYGAGGSPAVANIGTPTQQHFFLAPGEVIRNSGTFRKPTKIPGKPYFKDEVVIRNADSGKVMGIKGRRVHIIEEMSETVVSFQKVFPGAKERLVQITGPTEPKVYYAKQLIEETIRRNASPTRSETTPNIPDGSCSSIASSNSDDAQVQPRNSSGANIANRLSFNSAQHFMTANMAQQFQPHMHQRLHQLQLPQLQQPNFNYLLNKRGNSNSSRSELMHAYSTNDATLGEYKYTVNVGQHHIKITGDCCELVRAAKLLLDDYFSSSEFLASYEAGAAFDGTGLTPPLSTPTTPQYPLVSTPMHGAGHSLVDSGIALNYVSIHDSVTPDVDDDVFTDAGVISNGLARSRRSHFPRNDTTQEASSNKSDKTEINHDDSGIAGINLNGERIKYAYEHLIYFSKSPLSWSFPNDWERICEKTPAIVRNQNLNDETQRFSGDKHFLQTKTETKTSTNAGEELATEAEANAEEEEDD